MGRDYRATLDRAGLALAAGGLLGGLLIVGLVLLGGPTSAIGLAVALVAGSVLSAILAVAVGGPLWTLCHRIGWRGPAAAFLIGALAGFALFLAGQTYGFGLFDAPPSDARSLLFRWLSGIATSLVLALLCGGIGLAMWRVAYRRD